jgi:hypothetical protein
MLKLNTIGIDEFVQIRQVFDLHRFKLHGNLADGTVQSTGIGRFFDYSGFALDSFFDYSGFALDRIHYIF